MFRLKLTKLVLLAVAFLSLPIFILAQTNPTIEVCSGTCYPTVVPNTSIPNSQILVNNDDGSIPGDLTYKRGSTLRIHSNVSDPGGINYVKAIIEDALGNQLVIIPLFNDGASSHGDDAGLLNGSPTGATDTIYSNLWIAPFKLQTGVPYYLHIEAADNFAKDSSDITHVYKTDLYNVLGNELEFYLTDACLATCGTIGEYRCSKGVREECVFDAVNSCNAWKASSSCASGVCCGANSMVESAIGCCPVGSNFCDTSTYTCLTCDNTCNNSCSNTACPKSLDPDCGGGGCCGDGSCDAGVGETPGTCNADCPDTGVPTITITNPAEGASVPENAFFVIQATITDDWNPIATNPSATITMGGLTYGPYPLLPIGSGNFRSISIDALDEGFTTGAHTITIIASDIIGNTASNSGNFNIICANECSASSYPICDGNDKKECTLGGDGCYDITPITSCPTLFGGNGLCKNNNCCEENCNIGTYTPVCNGDGIHLNACVPQTDGCNRAESNLDCRTFLSNPAATCRTAPDTSIDGCCVDACTPGPATCNATGSAMQNCVVDNATGCYILQDTACVIPQICKDPTGPTPAACCANDCSPLGIKTSCGGAGDVFSMNCSIGVDGCNDISPNENCSLLGVNWDCRHDTDAGDYDCCKDDCSITDAPNCLTATTLANCNPVVGNDGCYNNTVTNCVTALGVGATCETNSSGADGCCLNTCTTIGEKRCNAGKVETCSEVASGCNNYVVTQDCTTTSGTCKDTGSGGPTCCNDSCSAVNPAFTCGSTGNMWVMSCNLDSLTGCFYSTPVTNCTGGPLNGCGINTTGSPFANCCTHNCVPSSVTCSAVVGSEELLTCDTIESDGCSGASSVDCAVTGQVCRTGSAGDGCCKDLCVSGSPTVCNDVKTGYQSCGTTGSGCTGLGAVTLCPGSQVCYNGANPLTDNAFCALPDSTPPVITITYPLPTTESWIEDSSDDFTSASSFTNTAVYSDSSDNASVLLSSVPNLVGAPWEQIIPGAPGNISLGGGMTYNPNTNLYYVLRGQPSPAIYSYSPASGIWATLTSVPLWHFAQNIGLGSAIHYPGSGDFLFVVAGEFSSGGTQKARFQGYNISTGIWDTTIPFTLPEGKSSGYGADLISTGANDLYFTPGSYAGAGVPLDRNEFYHYNVGSKLWTILADLPANYSWGANSDLVFDGSNDIYALVDYNAFGFGFADRLIRYNLGDSQWHTDVVNSIAGAFLAGYYPEMTYVPGTTNYIYLLGGSALARYPVGVGGWEAKSSPLRNAGYGSSFVYPGSGNLIYYLAGSGTEFYRYDMSADITSTSDWSSMASFTGTGPFILGYSSVYAQKYDKIYAINNDPEALEFKSYSTNDNLWGTEIASNLTNDDPAGGIAYDGNNYIYAFEEEELKRFNIATNGPWQLMTLVSKPTHAWSYRPLVFSNGDLYFVAQGCFSCPLSMYRIDLNGNIATFQSLAVVPVGSNVVVGNYIYSYSATAFFRFNTVSGLVETFALKLAPYPLGALTYPGSGDYIYGAANSRTELYRYSISTDTWSFVSFMPKAYANFLTATVSGNIYFMAGDKTFYRYNVLTYNTPGNYVSSIHDTEGNNGFGLINWSGALNGGTMTVNVRSCNNADCSDKPSTWVGCGKTNSSDISGGCVIDGERYIKYQAVFSTSDIGVSPSLNRMEIQYQQAPKFSQSDSIIIRATITDTGSGMSVTNPIVYLQNPDGTNRATLTLYDDATHGDNIAGNGQYGTNPWSAATATLGKYFIDILASDVAGNNTATTGNNIGSLLITDPCGGAVTKNYDGKNYTIKGFGGQCWFTQNLNVGNRIPSKLGGCVPGKPSAPFQYSNIEKFCFGDNEANCTAEGALYNWAETNGLEETCLTSSCLVPTENTGICPSGWHVANDNDWFALKNLYADAGTCSLISSLCSPAGTALKSGGISGFNTLQSGYINVCGNSLGDTQAFYHMPREANNTSSFFNFFSPVADTVGYLSEPKVSGKSVRCVKN